MGIHWYLSAAFVYGYGVLFVPILDTFGWSRTVGSLTALFMQPVGGAVGPAAGVLVDRYGARRVVFAGVLFMGFGIMSLSAMQALWMMFASFRDDLHRHERHDGRRLQRRARQLVRAAARARAGHRLLGRGGERPVRGRGGVDGSQLRLA